MSESDVKIPGLGSHSKRTVIIGSAAVVVVVGVAIYRRKQNAAIDGADVAVPDAQVDPATGYAYGSPQDAQSLANNADYAVAYPGSGTTSNASPPDVVVAATSNAQWSQRAQTYLVDTVGLPAASVSAALGAYLAGEAVSAAQKSIIDQATASQGLPPQQGANGYPPHIRLASTPTFLGKLGTPVVRVASKTTHSAVLSWPYVTNATAYSVHQQGHGVIKTIVPPSRSVTVPRPGTFYVQAEAPHWYSSNPSALITV